MNAPTDHRDLEVLSPNECAELLSATPVGRVAFISGGGPLILPVTYQYIDGRIVFRTSHGEKLAAARRNEVVAFEIDAWDADHRSGWSVVIQGRMQPQYDEGTIKAYESAGFVPWANEHYGHTWLEIRPEVLTGRRTGAIDG